MDPTLDPFVSSLDIATPTLRIHNAINTRLGRLDKKVFPKLERSYPSVGDINMDPPTDCAQLVVGARRVYQGKPGQERPGPLNLVSYVERSLEIGVAYSRKWPLDENGYITAAKEAEAGTKGLTEGQALMRVILEAYTDGDISGCDVMGNACTDVSIGPFTFIGPIGGIIGVTVLIAVQVQ